MFKFFTNAEKANEIRYPINKYSKFDHIKRKYILELDRVMYYYKNRDRSVRNTHMLSRLLKITIPSTDLDIVEYFKHVDVNARYVSRQFGVVSNIDNGRVLSNVLLSNHSKEIYLYTENDIDIFSLSDSWESYSPVRVIYSNNTDIDMEIFYGDTKEKIMDELTIFELDIVMMACQYYYWKKGRDIMDKMSDINTYIAMMVIPNILPSYMDISMVNRFFSLANGVIMNDGKAKHPFNVIDYTKDIDKMYRSLARSYRDTVTPIEQLYQTIRVISNENSLSTLHINHRYYTMQSLWVLWVARLSYITDTIKFLGVKGQRRNPGWYKALPGVIKTIERRASNLEGRLPELIYIDLLGDIEYIKQTIGKR